MKLHLINISLLLSSCCSSIVNLLVENAVRFSILLTQCGRAVATNEVGSRGLPVYVFFFFFNSPQFEFRWKKRAY